jgi:branched-chain amino acid transport system substrate-binding protein
MKTIIWIFSITIFLFSVFPIPAQTEEPVKIGFAYVFSHRLAHYGYAAKQGAMMAIDEINAQGGLLGRPVKAFFKDTKLDPPTGAEVAEQLINEQKVDAIMGVVSSAVAKAVAPVAEKFETPFLITLAMTPDVTGSICNRYTFRVNLNGPQNLKSAALLAADMDVKKWTTMGPDYLFGYQCWEYFKKYLSELRSDVRFASDSEIMYAPVSTTDFKERIDKLLKSDADGVLVSLYGGNLRDFIRQGQENDLFSDRFTFLMNLAYSTDVVYGLGMALPKGLWLGGQYWHKGSDTEANRDFVKKYKEKYRVFPDHNAQNAYTAVQVYKAAVEAAGTLDKDEVVKQLEGITVEAPVGALHIRAQDHQAVMDAFWGRTGEFDPELRARKLTPLKRFSGHTVTRSVYNTDCPRSAIAKHEHPE